MANIITGCRILFSILILFFPMYSTWFYILYLLCGLSDMLDGAIARKTNTDSEFGEKLDTFADIIFVAICMIKILPILELLIWMWIGLVLISLVKIINIIYGILVQKEFVSKHTRMNKITGILLFIFPLTINLLSLRYSASLLLTIALFAAIQEGHYIRTKR